MADDARLEDLLERFNTALAGVTPYKVAVVSVPDLVPVDKNAHYMTKRTYDQLVANVQHDGNLASLPFCWQQPDGRFVVLSGNHRVEAAAGVERVLILYTDQALSPAEQRAIQLSHNALVGQDRPQLLRELYLEIASVDLQRYSGLDDALLKTLEVVPIAVVSEAPLRYEEVVLAFVPAERERLDAVLKRLGATRAAVHYLAQVELFDRFVAALIEVKEALQIQNTATALLVMCEVMEQWLTAKEAQDGSGKLQSPGDGAGKPPQDDRGQPARGVKRQRNR